MVACVPSMEALIPSGCEGSQLSPPASSLDQPPPCGQTCPSVGSEEAIVPAAMVPTATETIIPTAIISRFIQPPVLSSLLAKSSPSLGGVGRLTDAIVGEARFVHTGANGAKCGRSARS